MIVDDRLDTVLRTTAAGPAGMRVQFRQLADILGQAKPAQWSQVHLAALDRLDSLHRALGDEDGAALLRSAALRSPVLVEHFAHHGPKAALGAIAGARLDEAQWLRLIPTLPVQARGFLRHRRDLGATVEALLARLGIDDFVLPMPAQPEAPAAAVAAPAPKPERASEPRKDTASEGIGAIVRRIEAFRRSREARDGALSTTEPAHPRLPFADEPGGEAPALTSVDLTVDAEGTIVSADGAVAAMLVGHRPFTGEAQAPAICDATTLRMIRARLPIEAGLVTFEGAAPVAGIWRIDAVPTFAREGGPFTGYQARLRRPGTEPAAAANDDERADDAADRLRQLLHELRTPVNAIQGFAELIQQQLFGPTPHQYRSLAASITADAARMLAGFEEVERLVRLEAGRLEEDLGPGEDGAGADLAATVTRLVGQLEPVTAPREIKLRWHAPAAPVRVAMAAGELERSIWRILSVMAGAAAPGERLALAMVATADGATNASAHSGAARLEITLPAAIAMREDSALFAPDGVRGGPFAAAATLGSGFALRLAAAELRAVGGTLQRNGGRLLVDVPLLTDSSPLPSHKANPAIGGA